MKSWLIGKDLGAGKDWEQEKGETQGEMLDGIIDSIDMSLSKLQEIVKVSAAVQWGLQRDGATQWTTTTEGDVYEKVSDNCR